MNRRLLFQSARGRARMLPAGGGILLMIIAAFCGSPLPEGGDASFSLPLISGGTFTDKDLKGNITVVDFWATWCGPCRVEVPHYNNLQRKYEEKGIKIVGIAVSSGSLREVKDASKLLKIDYPVALGSNRVMRLFGGVGSVPTTFLVDREGRITRVWRGAGRNKSKELEKEIERLLDGKA